MKWEDSWFLDLPNEHKIFWTYLLDKCDMAGVWKINKRMADFCLGFSVDLQAFLKLAGDRIEIHDDKWFLTGFITFQYGDLTEANKVYRSVMSCLSSLNRKKGHLSPLKGGKDKTKTSLRQDKDKRGAPPSRCFKEFLGKTTAKVKSVPVK